MGAGQLKPEGSPRTVSTTPTPQGGGSGELERGAGGMAAPSSSLY